MAKPKTAVVSLKMIHESEVALRPVNRQAETYLELVESIRSFGILNAPSVREIKNPDTGKLEYGLVDGLQRFTASKDAGLVEIPVNILTLSDAQVLQAQIVGNVHKIETKPAQYTKQIIRILALDNMMTIADLAKSLQKSISWINQRLSLARLDAKIQELVDCDKIGLSNAYALAILPIEEQGNFVERAMTESPTEFMPAMHARAKEIKDAKRKGKDSKPAEFQPVAFAQKLTLVKEIFNSTDGEFEKSLVKTEGCKTPLDGVKAAIAWFLHLDSMSAKEQVAKDAARKAEQKAERERRKKERDDRKAAEASKTEAELAEKK